MAKVVVLGAPEAGKSTLVRVLSENALNLEVRGRTVAMDVGRLGSGARQVSLVGVPGQSRFLHVREALVRGARAALWVVAAGAQPDSETARLLASPSLRHVPYALVVNCRVAAGEDFPLQLAGGLRAPLTVTRLDLLAEGAAETLAQVIWRLC